MPLHIVDISDTPTQLRVVRECLSIQSQGRADVVLPLGEVAVVVLAEPCTIVTQSALAWLMRQGGALVACGERRLPVGMMLPLDGHFVQAERFAAQARAKVPLRKRLWAQIVRGKIEQQAILLRELRGGDHGLAQLTTRVLSGDTTNVEAQAARRYWKALFPGQDFHRDREGEDQNRLLNYGYTVLRGVVGRAICAAGLHPSLGLHHRNRYNPFCLADDLMEPFRPAVDRVVAEFVDDRGADVPLEGPVRRRLLQVFSGRWLVDDERRTLFDVVQRLASSLADCFTGARKELELPRGIHAESGL